MTFIAQKHVRLCYFAIKMCAWTQHGTVGTILIAHSCTDFEPFVTLDFIVHSKNSKIKVKQT